MKTIPMVVTCLLVMSGLLAGCQKRETGDSTAKTNSHKTSEGDGSQKIWLDKIHEYACDGDIKAVRTLLDRGVPVDQPKRSGNGEGTTPLMGAASRGHLQIVRLLLDRGADVNSKTRRGLVTPLMAASGSVPTVNGKHTECVRTLIKAGADLEAQDSENQTALFYACGYAGFHWTDQDEMREDLRKYQQFKPRRKGPVGSIPLQHIGPFRWCSMIYGDADRVRLLLEAGANPNALLTYKDKSESLLMLAAGTSDAERIQLLLDHRANVDFVGDWDGETALIRAAGCGDMAMFETIFEVDERFANGNDLAYRRHVLKVALTAEENALDKVRYLLNSGLDIDSDLPNGRSPILQSITSKHGADVARLLLNMGASINMQEATKPENLRNAAKFGPAEAIEAIIENGADPNIVLSEKRNPTALIAASASDVDAGKKVALLIEAGSRLEEVDFQNKTALTRAAIKGNMDAVVVLANAGANVNTFGERGSMPRYEQFTPLMYVANRGGDSIYACEQDGLAAAKALVANGADIDAVDEWCGTALDIARANEQDEIVAFLESLEVDANVNK